MTRSTRVRRPLSEWVARGLLGAALAVVGLASVAFSIAQSIAKGNERTAHLLAPYDGRITALRAASLTSPDASEVDRRVGETMARLALRQDPTAVIASATLALTLGLHGVTSEAQRQIGYAQRLSRRNLQVELWAIEDAVARGDIAGALRHYDIALRTSPNAEGTLFPVLTSASADPAIRMALVRTLASRPLWADRFISFIATNGTDPQATAMLFVALRHVGMNVPQDAQAGLLAALIGAGQLDQAWNYYATLRPGVDRRRSRDPRFAANLAQPTAFDWTPIGEGGINSSIQGGALEFSAPASVGGPLLQQTQLLPPGTYRLVGYSDGIDQADGARPYWTLACRGGNRLGRVDVPNSINAKGMFMGSFVVPQGCPVQYLTLVASPSDAVGGLSGRIDRAELVLVQ